MYFNQIPEATVIVTVNCNQVRIDTQTAPCNHEKLFNLQSAFFYGKFQDNQGFSKRGFHNSSCF
jgi:hypothetical protein